jgi:ssDNA thymidine ADP-ribosyltransferase DarT-like protein
MSKDLNPQKALIFRIVHRDNMADVWASGCHCKSTTKGKKYTQIGNLELISRRDGRVVPCDPGGTLSDYVPFYFTPYTPMLYNIKTGYGGVQKRPVEEIVILISSLHTVKSQGVLFVFSDRHAYLKTALFSNDLADLDRIIMADASGARLSQR